jgi:hypothetical protein
MPSKFLGCLVLASSLTPNSAQSDDFAIDLTVQAGKTTKTMHASGKDLKFQPPQRAVIQAKAGDRIGVNWTVRNNDANATLKDVLVHLFVVREQTLGQSTVPKLDKDVAAETAMTMDFKPKDKASGTVAVALARPGFYLLRLETIGAANGPSGREYFAAVDLDVK